MTPIKFRFWDKFANKMIEIKNLDFVGGLTTTILDHKTDILVLKL